MPTMTGSRGSPMAEAHSAVEAHPEHESTGISNVKLGMWVFLSSEFLFFGALIANYLLYSNRAGFEGIYPAEIYDIPFTSVSSFVLLMSSLTMVLAHHAHTLGDMRRMRLWILATAGQGMVFLGGQIFEFTVFYREGLNLTESPFASAFFVLTGFHGLHVFVGILMLLGLYSLSVTGKVKPNQHLKTEMIGLYWHFVDIIWVVIFTVVYLIPDLAMEAAA
jgi:heme/copper-type cytochrome/quinol oxidase subunit 3